MTTPHIHVDSAASLEAALHRLIPISKHMGITVTEYTGTGLTLAAPLQNNINHQQSAFGGSLFSIAALAGWGLLQLKFTELGLDCDTVIANGDVSYRRPVYSDLQCVVSLPPDWHEFIDTLKSALRASIVLSPTILIESKTAMTLSGNFVATQRQVSAP